VLLWSALERADVMPARGCRMSADAGVTPTAIRVTWRRARRSRAVSSRDQSICWAGSCNVALRAAAAALRVGSDIGEGARWHRSELHDMPVAPLGSIRNDAPRFLGHHI